MARLETGGHSHGALTLDDVLGELASDDAITADARCRIFTRATFGDGNRLPEARGKAFYDRYVRNLIAMRLSRKNSQLAGERTRLIQTPRLMRPNRDRRIERVASALPRR